MTTTIATAATIITAAVVLRAALQVGYFIRSRCSARRPWMPCPRLAGLFHSRTATLTLAITLQQQQHEQQLKTLHQQNNALQQQLKTLQQQHNALQQQARTLQQQHNNQQHQINTHTLVYGDLSYHLRTLRRGVRVTRAEDIPIPENHTPWELE